MIRLIATDLDNTLLDQQGAIPPSSAALLRRAGQRGALTAVATGRCYPSALGAARAIGSHTPIICYNGSLIRRGDTGEVLSRSLISPEHIRMVARFCRERSLYLQLFDLGDLSAAAPQDAIVAERLCDATRIDPDLGVIPCREVGDYLTAPLNPTPKMLLVERPERVEGRLAELAAAFPMLSFCQSQPWLIEIMPPEADKGKALARLAGLLGIAPSEVLALGDNTNDLPMLLWAGTGAAVANAVPAVRARADYVCAAPRSLGVEEAVRRFVLEEPDGLCGQS